jgi:hypothetical protein
LLEFGVSAHQLGAISVGVGGIAGDSAAAGDQEFANYRGVVCTNEGCADREALRGGGQDLTAILTLLGGEADGNAEAHKWEEPVEDVF